ncbi:hypothetical protein F2Q70_00026988 [Brassica cretica]|uniref:Uncharacterized protein n=1 Tax=Brassica cretica TaxID=69181 RepID=A0A8S9GA45_BRACR|nr:hypothetical protein F2Q68_00030989 [Brassica cretica]KAF2603565.1 hypothetical protein F2Q70_00026988 [Brassica cretica]
MTRTNSPGEHDCVAGRLAGELGHDTSQLSRRARPCCRSTRRLCEETGFRWKNHTYTNDYFASKVVKTLKSRYGPKRVRIADNGPSMVPKDLNPKTGMTVYPREEINVKFPKIITKKKEIWKKTASRQIRPKKKETDLRRRI